MPRCQICSFELAFASDRCANCGAAAGGGDSTLVNADFDPAELLRAAAALADDDDDELSTRVSTSPAESTITYGDGSEEAAYVQQLLRGSRPSPDVSGDSTSVYPGPVTAPSDMTAEDAPVLSRSRDQVLADAGFPNPDSVADDDDIPTGNLPPVADDPIANDATIQEQDLADLLDADMRAAIAKLKSGATTKPPENIVDDDATFEMQALVRPRRANEDEAENTVDDIATQQLMRDDVLSFMAKPAPQTAGGDATVELTDFKSMLPAKSTQPTKLPPIPLPANTSAKNNKMTQPTSLQPPGQQGQTGLRPPQPSIIIPAPPERPVQNSQFMQQPHGSQFGQQPGYPPGFNQSGYNPQGSQFAPQPQGSQFAPQPQGSQFMQQPQGSQFAPQPQQFAQQPGFPQPPPAHPVEQPSQLILGLPRTMFVVVVGLAVVVVIGAVVIVWTLVL